VFVGANANDAMRYGMLEPVRQYALVLCQRSMDG
jgi:hypothetical protein